MDKMDTGGEAAAATEEPPLGDNSNRRRARQLGAVVKKNFMVNRGSQRACMCCTGWVALLFDLVVPVVFFLILFQMRMKKSTHGQNEDYWRALEQGEHLWRRPLHQCKYNCRVPGGGDFKLILAPSSSVQSMLPVFAKALGCSQHRTNLSEIVWYRTDHFADLIKMPPACQDYDTCLSNTTCHEHIIREQFLLEVSAESAMDFVRENPDEATAAVIFETDDLKEYSIRMQDSAVPGTERRFNFLKIKDIVKRDPAEDYIHFANIQSAIDRSLLAAQSQGIKPHEVTESLNPLNIDVSIDKFPTPAYTTIHAGNGELAILLRFIFGLAFIMNTKSIVADIVQEKEFRLREGMRILGLGDGPYWLSWAITHIAYFAVIAIVLTGMGWYALGRSNPFLLGMFYFLAGIALTSYAFFISTLFSKSKVAGTLTLMIYVVSMMPGIVIPIVNKLGGSDWLAACLLPPSALAMFGEVLWGWEFEAFRGLTFETAASSIHFDNHFSLATVYGFILLDIVLYGVLTWYFDKVIPKDYGQTYPPWFIFLPSYWRPGCFKNSFLETENTPYESMESALLQHQQDGVAVHINNLRKDFILNDGTKRCAVDGISLDIHKGTVLALLGHNGAGKTTTINVLTGMMSPSGGAAFISGLPIRSRMSEIRNKIGLCPQFDILWPMLTVKEHLELYASIKGYSGPGLANAAVQAADSVGLLEKYMHRAETLSGGQKRKLSVAIAFLGEPEVVFLDEPTTGMDPAARRQTMEIIQSRKEGRAIVVTTHLMEEADALSDKIAIMANGKLAAMGTSLELKSDYGDGYTLTFILDSDPTATTNPWTPTSDAANLSPAMRSVANLVQSHVPTATLLSSAANEISFRLVTRDASKFAGLLRDIESRKRELGIGGYGLSVTTLEEVFLKVNDQTYQGKAGVASVEEKSTHKASEIFSGRDRNTGMKLFAQQFWGMFMKRVNMSRRERTVLLWQMFIPLLLVVVAVLVQKTDPSRPESPLLLDRRTALAGKSPLYHSSRSDEADVDAFISAWDQVKNTDPEESREDLITNIVDRWYKKKVVYDAVEFSNVPSVADIRSGMGILNVTLMLNSSAFHALPGSLNSFHNGLYKLLKGDGEIKVTTHPLPRIGNDGDDNKETLLTAVLMVLLAIAMSIMAASFIMLIIREEESGSKQVQLVSGASVGPFWLGHAVADFLIFLIPAAATMMLIAVMELPMFSDSRLGAMAFLFVIFGMGFIPKTYAWSFAFDNEMKGLQRVTTFYIIESVVGSFVIFIMDLIRVLSEEGEEELDKKDFINMTIVRAVLKIVSPHLTFNEGVKGIAFSYYNFLDICGLDGDYDEVNDTCSPWRWSVVGEPALILIGQCFVFWTIVFALEEGPIKRTVARLRIKMRGSVEQRNEGAPPAAEDADDLVLEEIERVGTGQIGALNVALQNVSKTYVSGLLRRKPPVRAVQNLSLGITEGECFGLLGTNGAGKTTTFKMLTGQVVPTQGKAFISGFSTQSQLQHARQCTGYAPQVHGLPKLLTGKEVLTLYARLRGAKEHEIPEMVDFLLKHLSLTTYANQTCGTYSGGNQRKLSVALAIIGNSPVVLLDEPSSGMDPGARRFLWEVIKAETTSVGHSVVLSSHSMEECEALCSRIGIMVDGQLKALGTQQQLKNRYGTGYVLEVRTPPLKGEEIKNAVHGACPSVVTIEGNDNRIRFKIPNEQADIPRLFEIVEKAKLASEVLEYSISQTKLEDVFLHLAKGAAAVTVQIE